MARSLTSCLSPVLFATFALSAVPAAQADKRNPAPIEYASLGSATSQTQGQGSHTAREQGVPQPNSSATRDSWRGPVTRTGPAKLPENREKVSFSYPGSKPSPVTGKTNQQYASVESAPRASTPETPKKLWPEQTGARPAVQSLTLGSETAAAGSEPASRAERVKPKAAGVAHEERGLASWYGEAFHGKPTANGEIFDMDAMTAAHRTLPLPSLVQVVNEANGKEIVVRVNDRGPFEEGRIIDLSRRAASALDIVEQGEAPVVVRYLGPAPAQPDGKRQMASVEDRETSGGQANTSAASRMSRPDLYGNMLLGGAEPSLGVPDPGKDVATPARVKTADLEPYRPRPDSGETLAGGSDVRSAPLPPVQQRPAARPQPRTVYAAASPARQTASATPSRSFTPQIYVQVGAFTNIGNAQGMHAQVGRGFHVKVEDVRIDGADYFRVLVGPYPTRDAAERAKVQLGTRGVRDSFVTLR